MKGLTVEDLYKLCSSLIAHGYKDKEVLISQDDEGNGYHTLWGEVIAETNEVRAVSAITYFHDGNNPEDVVLLG